MKLLQLNMWMGRLTRQILPLIEREKPDIICGQEVFSAVQPVAFPDSTVDLFELIQVAGEYKYCYFSPVCTLDIEGQTAKFGNAVWSKYPITHAETVFSNGNYSSSQKNPDFDPNARNAQFITLDIENIPLQLINHHGYWEPNPHGSEATVAAMKIIADKIKQLEGKIVFVGDLNVDPGTPALKLFDGWLEDLTATHGITNTLSQLAKVQEVACDHIFVNSRVRVQDFRVLDDLVSDHKAIMFEFDL